MDPFDLAADLDEHAAETPELPPDSDPESVELPDDLDECRDLANRLLRKHSRLGRDEAAVRATASAEMERIAEWANDRTYGIDRERDRIESLLDRLTRSWHLTTHAKTLKLPNGELRLRPAKQRLVVEDDDAFVKWAEQRGYDTSDRGGLVRTKKEPDANAIKGAEWSKELSMEPLPGLKRWRLVDIPSGDVVPGVYMETDEEQTFGLTSKREESLS